MTYAQMGTDLAVVAAGAGADPGHERPAAGRRRARTTAPATAPGRPRLRAVGASALVGASMLAVWALAADTHLAGREVIGPIATAQVIHDQWSLVWFNLAPTLTAAATGLAVTLLLGAAAFVAIVAVPRSAGPVAALGVVLGVLPLVAVTPALSVLFTRGSQLTSLITVISGAIPVFAALGAISRLHGGAWREFGEVYATSRWRWWRLVGLPRALPIIDVAIKGAVPACLLGTIVAEWAGASGDRGLGEVMVNAVFSFEAPLAWATITISAVVALAAMGAVSALSAPVLRRWAL